MSNTEPLTWVRVRAIRDEYSPIPSQGPTQAELAEKYNTTQGMVSQVIRETVWVENESAPSTK